MAPLLHRAAIKIAPRSKDISIECHERITIQTRGGGGYLGPYTPASTYDACDNRPDPVTLSRRWGVPRPRRTLAFLDLH